MDSWDICITALPRDAGMARALAESLRRYRLPDRVALPDPAADYRRVTLDVSGGPLDDQVRPVLEHSRFLVVLCSPPVRTHQGILDRLDWFRRDHDNDHIVAVLAEAEPVDSFPENFTEEKLVRHIMPDMSVVERMEKIEPIAADLRGDTRAKRRQALRYETVRIAASVLGIHPDALEQRHRARRRRAVLAALILVGSVCLTAAGIFLRLGLIAKAEGDIAQEQTMLSVQIAARTMEELPTLFEGDAQAMEYVDKAVSSAREGLEELGLGELLETQPGEGG